MFCPKCGSENQENTKFCCQCGAALGGTARSVDKSVHNQPKGMKSSEIGKTASNIKSEIRKWLSKYMETWRKCHTLEKKEKNLWFGIHGVVLLLLCIIFVPLFFGGSGGSRCRVNIEKMLKEAAADGEINEDDMIKLAQAISNYEDIQRLEQIFSDNFEEMANIPGFLNLTSQVPYECRNQSGLGEMMGRYGQWYDRDGLSKKIYARPDQVENVYLSMDGSMLSMGKNGNSFREEYNGCFVEVEWFAYADSNEITFVKTTYEAASQEKKTEQYDGRYELSDTEILVTLEGKKYCMSEASTDFEARHAESFAVMSQGNWVYSAEFHDMLANYLGDWEKLNNPYDEKPLYVTFNGNPGHQLIVMGVDGIYLERLKDFSAEQGEGKTATFSSAKGSVEVSYDMSGTDLVITVNGADYVLSPAAITNTGTYNPFGGKN